MRTERIGSEASEQQPVVYATLDEALRVKMERTKYALNKLKLEARTRLANKTDRGRDGMSSI